MTLYICCGCDLYYGVYGGIAAWACAFTRGGGEADQPCDCDCHRIQDTVATIWGDLPLGHDHGHEVTR